MREMETRPATQSAYYGGGRACLWLWILGPGSWVPNRKACRSAPGTKYFARTTPLLTLILVAPRRWARAWRRERSCTHVQSVLRM